MADSARKVMDHVFDSTGADASTAEHVVHGTLVVPFENAAAADRTLLLMHPQVDIELTAVSIVPAVASAAHATNYAAFTLQVNDLAGGSATALDSFDTDSNNDNISLAVATEQAFTIVPDTDQVDAGQGLYLDIAHTASGVASAGAVVIDYRMRD